MNRSAGAAAAALVTLVLSAAACPRAPAGQPAAPAAQVPVGGPLDTIPGTTWTNDDWRLFEATVRWGVAARLDTLPAGAAIVQVGRRFVGVDYKPGTLEAPGPERLVIDLREFDCVTFVENVLALSHFIRHDGARVLADPPKARARYEAYLRDLRYRDGRLDGYPSRLHYFSEWLSDHERRGMLRQLGDEIGAVPDDRPIDFMTTHATAYRQLADSANLAAIRQVEARLNAGPKRRYVPKAAIQSIESRLRDGDVLAMTSALPGLDVAHTGIAVMVDGRPHLLNAPLVGKSVELSPLPLPEHLAARSKQTGVMVGRMRSDW